MIKDKKPWINYQFREEIGKENSSIVKTYYLVNIIMLYISISILIKYI